MNPITPTAPANSSYTTQSFANAIRAKYPDGVASDGTPYAKMNDQELTKRIIAKYPVYGSQIKDPTQLGQGAAGEFGAGVVKAVAQPLVRTGAVIESGLDETLGRAGNIIAGKGNVPTQTGAEAFKAADTMNPTTPAEHIGNLVGTIAPYLTGMGEEEAASTIANALPKLAEKSGMSVQTLLPKIVSFLGEHAPSVIKNTAIGTAQTGNPVQGVETGVGGEILGSAGKPIQAIAKGAYKGLAVPVSKAEAKVMQAYRANTPFMERVASALKGEARGPITADETAFRKGLWGTEGMMGVQAKKASDALWKNGIKPALEKSDVNVDLPKFFADAEKQIVKNNPELTRQKDLLEALKSIKEDYAGTDSVPLKKLQDLKKGWAKFVPQKAYQGKDISGAFNDVKNMLAGQARKIIYDALGPEMKQAYIDHSNLQSLAEWGQTAMTGSKFKGGTGSLLNAAKDAVLTPIATIGGHVLYKVGQGMEFIGPPTARVLSDLFSGASQNQQ